MKRVGNRAVDTFIEIVKKILKEYKLEYIKKQPLWRKPKLYFRLWLEERR